MTKEEIGKQIEALRKAPVIASTIMVVGSIGYNGTGIYAVPEYEKLKLKL